MYCTESDSEYEEESTTDIDREYTTKYMRLDDQGSVGANNVFRGTTYDFSDVTSFSLKAKVNNIHDLMTKMMYDISVLSEYKGPNS